MSAAEPIPRRKLAHEVQERLLQRINRGEFPPGERLPSERELMQAYAVGRPAVREALQALERAGIVTISHGERARVARPTAGQLIEQLAQGASHLLRSDAANLEHLKDARLFLEVGLARRAAERADQAGIAELGRRLADHEAARRADLDRFLEKDMAFHRQIAAMSGNPIFPALIEAMFGWLAAYYRHLVRLPGAEDVTITEHRRLHAAIAAGDPTAAAAAMHDHLTRASALYRPHEQQAEAPR